jgi:DNA-binding LytR/AlgR family response regulator
MRAYKAIIAEDESVLRSELKEMLGKLWPELTICAEVEDGIEALHALEIHAPEVMFLDIEMPEMNGLEVARQASGKCHVVFVTAYDKFAVAAFEEGAVDYVMKPFSPVRLATTVARLKEKVQAAPATLDGLLKALAAARENGKEYLRWITASQGSELRLITVEEICYFRADNKYTLIVTPDHESLIRRPIKELTEELDPDIFWQIHRGTLVNINAIAGITRDIGGQLRVRLKQRKETLQVSEPYVCRFRSL